MDRGKSFRILGVNENATKEQVTMAYERKAAMYKGANYADEPAYADRKLRELYQAYQEARALAEHNPDTSSASQVRRNADGPKDKKTVKASRLLEEERNAAAHSTTERIHQWMERRDEKKNRDTFEDGGSTGLSKKKPELKLPNLKKLDLSKLKEKMNEILPDNELFQEIEVVQEAEEASSDSGQVLGEAGTTEQKKTEEAGTLAGSIVSIAVALFLFFVGACGDGDISDDYENVYIYDQAVEEIHESDSAIADLADKSYGLLSEQEEWDSSTLIDDNEIELQEKADQFARIYWQKDSLQEVTRYLYQDYGSYMTYEEDPLTVQLDAIFAFYGFSSLENASWYKQPYTGEPIQSYGDYLAYLNQYYDSQKEAAAENGI